MVYIECMIVLFSRSLSRFCDGKSVIEIDSSFCGEFKTIVTPHTSTYTLYTHTHGYARAHTHTRSFCLGDGNVTLPSSEFRVKGWTIPQDIIRFSWVRQMKLCNMTKRNGEWDWDWNCETKRKTTHRVK